MREDQYQHAGYSLWLLGLKFAIVLMTFGVICSSQAPHLYADSEGTTSSKAGEWQEFASAASHKEALPLPESPNRVIRGLYYFLRGTVHLFKTKYHSNPEEFFTACRQSLIYWIPRKQELERIPDDAAIPEQLVLSDPEPGTEDDPHFASYEMKLIEEKREEPQADGSVRVRILRGLAVKYAPAEAHLHELDREKNGVRVVFHNVEHPATQGMELINPLGSGPDAYHARINFNRKRNALVFDMEGTKQIRSGYFFPRPAFLKGLLPNPRWWKGYFKAKYQHPDFKFGLSLGVISASIQAGISYEIFHWLGNHLANHNSFAAIATWTYVVILATWGKFYGNIVRNKDITTEVFLRFLIGLPLAFSLAIANHADFKSMHTLVNLLLIPLGDKFASAVYSFIPMLREERGLTAGKKVLGVFNRAIVEREITAITRMFIQQVCLVIATNPHIDYRFLGNLGVWLSAVPVYFWNLHYAKDLALQIRKVREDVKRLRSWVNPKTYAVGILRHTRNFCDRALAILSAPPETAEALSYRK